MATAQMLRVMCPRCKVGSVTAVVTHQNGEDTLEGMHDPHQCPACRGWFRFKIRLHVVGVPLPTAGPTTPQGTVLRNLLATATD
jgi:hypothetical protein